MTFSILAREPETGVFGAAAATGWLCVGAWVLRGDPIAGLTASQGALPSTLWGERALAGLRAGRAARDAVSAAIVPDAGREHRQLSALDAAGRGAAHTGRANTVWRGHRVLPDLVLAGNLLSGEAVLDALLDGFRNTTGPMAERLLAALAAAEAAGGDTRGLQSAALLVLSESAAPLDLRIDWSERPVADLTTLYQHSRAPDYVAWMSGLPTHNHPEGRDD